MTFSGSVAKPFVCAAAVASYLVSFPTLTPAQADTSWDNGGWIDLRSPEGGNYQWEGIFEDTGEDFDYADYYSQPRYAHDGYGYGSRGYQYGYGETGYGGGFEDPYYPAPEGDGQQWYSDDDSFFDMWWF